MNKQTLFVCRVSQGADGLSGMACRALHALSFCHSSALPCSFSACRSPRLSRHALLLLLGAGLLAGTAQAATKDWVGTGVNMGTAANWSPTNVPGSTDIARWNASSYGNQPTMNTALTFGQLLFGEGNSGTVTIGGSSQLTLNRIDGVGLQMTNGAVTINAPVLVNNHRSQSFINNNPSGSGALTIVGRLVPSRSRLTVSGSGDVITSELDPNEAPGVTMNGTGKLTFSGSANNEALVMLANSGTLLLGKSSANAISSTPLIIGQGNTTPALVQYTGDSSDMIANAVAVTIYGAGQLDLNGKSDTIGTLTIDSTGASGDSTPINNSGSGGTLTCSTLAIAPRTGYTTTINSGTGTNTVTADITFNSAGSGTARIIGNLHLNNAVRTFTINDGEAENDMVIDAVIIGGGASGGFAKGNTTTSRMVLGGSNVISGAVSVNRGILRITNSLALGTANVLVRYGDAATQPGCLELMGNISVGSLPLTLRSIGPYSFGALRNVSGNNSWGGPITLEEAARTINSERDTLTLHGVIAGATFGLTITGAGNTTITNGICTTSGTLTKNGAGTLTLSGTNTFTGATTVNDGTLVLDYSTQDNSKLSDTAALTLSKGTLTLSGGSHTETNLSTTLNAGSFAVTRSGGTSVLRMNAITRNTGNTIDFGADSIADTDTANVNGILGVGYATVGGAGWAYNSTAGSDGLINALPSGSYTANAANSLGATTNNSDMSGGVDTTVATGTSINSIRFNNAATRTITIGGGQTLTVTSGGILNTTTVGNNANVITGGTISGSDMKVHQYNTANTLRIDSVVAGASFTKTGPGTLILGGASANTFSGTAYINGGEVDLDKSGSVQAIPGTVGLTINQTGIVKYTGTSTDMIGTGAITINENGQLDFNGKADTIGAITIDSTGASGDTCPITNSTPASGNLTVSGLTITPLSGYNTLIQTGSGGTNTLAGNVTLNAAGNGTAWISGNMNLGTAARTITVNDGDAYNDMVIDAIISGTNSITKAGTGRLVLGSANTYTGATTVSAGILTITNGNSLGTADGATTVSSANTLELLGNIAVVGEPLTLSSVGVTVGSAVGGLRNVSGDNTWGGPVTLGAASGINSDSGTLTFTNSLAMGANALTVGSYGNVAMSGVISGTAGTLTKAGLGTLTLSGANANTFTNLTTITEGTLVLAKTGGVAVSNLTITGSATYNGAYGLVRYGSTAGNSQISGTVTINANARGAGQLDFNGATDTITNVTIVSTAAIADSRPIVNTGSGGMLTINSLNITPVDQYITKLDSGTNGVLRLGGNVTFTAAAYGQGMISGILDLNGATRTLSVGLGTDPIYDLGISAVIANGALTKAGTGRLYLSGANTYAGDTLVSAGTLEVAATGSITNSPTITVATNAILQTDSANALGTNATLALVSDGLNANYGKANLNFVGTQTVAVLRFDGVAQGGTWGSSSSTAANKTNTWFSGTGVVLVNGPQIQNEAVTNVSDTGATFNGWLVSNGPATVGVLWGTTDGGISGDWANTNWFDSEVASGTHLSTNISLPTPGVPYYYTFVASNASAVVVRAAPSVTFVPQSGTTKTWLTTGSTDLMASGNWSPAGVPNENCNLIINTAGGNQPVLNLASGSVTIKSLSIGATAGSTLTFTNGNVDTKILNVLGDVTIGPNGTLTHAADWSTGTTVGSESNRLCMVVGGNLTIAVGGKINVDSKGYSIGNGPGGSTVAGSHGGQGGHASGISSAPTYGSITTPVNSGSGGFGGAGGGTIKLIVSGVTTNNGVISANGNSTSGAGGSIWLRTQTLSGLGNASITANGGAITRGGGGGRVAVILTTGGDFANYAGSMTAYGGVGAGGSTISAAGTVYREVAGDTAGQGELIVNNNNLLSADPVSTAPLGDPNGDFKPRTTDLNGKVAVSYTFSRLTLTNAGVIGIGPDDSLNLAGVTTINGQAGYTNVGIRLTGGTLTMPAVCVISNYFISIDTNGSTFNPATSLAIATNGALYVNVPFTNTSPGGLTIQAGGLLSHNSHLASASPALADATEKYKIDLTVTSLTVNAGGSIKVDGLGYPAGKGPGTSGGGGGYGGQGMRDGIPYISSTYGSITNPVNLGSGGGAGSAGGGAIKLAVNGATTNDGVISAKSKLAGSGGSILLTTKTLSGAASGSIAANGGNDSGRPGGGGRVAVFLTQPLANFANYAGGMTAYGGTYSPGGPSYNVAAGTVYRKTADQAYGDLIVDNNGNASAFERTLVTNTVAVGNVQIQGAANVVLSNATLIVYGSWSNAVATNAISGGTVELAGTAPATVWGGNTWSNLTITTAGKVVSFQTNVIQYVYGTPAFSNNITIQSTSSGYFWYLNKPGAGTQDVGVVQVQDSNATNGWTFRAKAGSLNKGHNINWIFTPASGTVIMLR